MLCGDFKSQMRIDSLTLWQADRLCDPGTGHIYGAVKIMRAGRLTLNRRKSSTRQNSDAHKNVQLLNRLYTRTVLSFGGEKGHLLKQSSIVFKKFIFDKQF